MSGLRYTLDIVTNRKGTHARYAGHSSAERSDKAADGHLADLGYKRSGAWIRDGYGQYAPVVPVDR